MCTMIRRVEYRNDRRRRCSLEKDYSKRVKVLAMVIDCIEVYLTDETVIDLLGRVDVVIAVVIVSYRMVTGRKGIVQLSYRSGV